MGAGGSRCGAGRPGWRRKCEHTLALDVRRLRQRDCLRPGSSWGWHWSRDGEPCGDIGLTVYPASVQLSYVRTREGGKPETFRYHVPLESTPCHFGGCRHWFRCPWCQRRCALIYGLSADGYFGCRLCLRLAYASECESRLDRLWRRMRKLEALLIDGELKPKGMRTRTYERICAEIDETDDALDAEWFARSAGLFARLGMNPEDLLSGRGAQRAASETHSDFSTSTWVPSLSSGERPRTGHATPQPRRSKGGG
jgi:hypothetical protein